MQIISYQLLKEEIISILNCEKSIVLATSYENKVTARTMSHVNSDLTIYFQTSRNSEKAAQIAKNPQIAFATANLQIEAVAEFCGQPDNVSIFADMYKEKFPQYYENYSSAPDEIVIKATPDKIILYKYIDGKAYRDILNVSEQTAFRI